MNITIKDDNASQTNISCNKLFLKNHLKAYKRNILFYSSLGVALIIYSIIDFDTPTWRSGFGGNVKDYNIHLFLGVGITFVFISLSNLRRMITEKNKFLYQMRQNALRHYSTSNTKIIVFDDEGIKITTPLINEEIKWAAVTSFMTFDDFLLILQDSSFQSITYIDKKNINNVEFTQLLNFLSENKTETKSFDFPL